jgi:hypothetical protein
MSSQPTPDALACRYTLVASLAAACHTEPADVGVMATLNGT